MLNKLKNLFLLLQNADNEDELLSLLRDFFVKNFNLNANIILDEDYVTKECDYELTINNNRFGCITFEKSSDTLKNFMGIALPVITLKFQNISLSVKMQRAIDFQNSMKNMAKIIETQYELHYIIPLLGEIIDKFISEHLIYIFLKTKSEYKLMWPNACNDSGILDIINAEPLKRVNTNNMGVFPLICEGKLLGYIVTKIIDEKLSYKEIEYLDELSKQAATTINRATVYAEILKNATLDALTGFYNRGQLEERIKQEIASSKRQKTPLCAIMTDIDFFKKVNDTYGHAAGDLILKTVSKVIRSQLREYDIAGRYGGEEFAILLPFTKAEEAQMVAERLRKAIEEKVIDITKVNPDANEKEISVTLSIGVYEFCTTDEDDDLLKNADKALYKAKETGRNKVIVYDKV